MKMRLKRKGFTLIELIIVVIIIGILAAIAAPMMSSNVQRARRSEAVAALGAIRTAARCYAAENSGTYPATLAQISGYIGAADLNGPNYSYANYNIVTGVAHSDAGTQSAGAVNMDLVTGAMNGN